jgi:hypothetical protein
MFRGAHNISDTAWIANNYVADGMGEIQSNGGTGKKRRSSRLGE